MMSETSSLTFSAGRDDTNRNAGSRGRPGGVVCEFAGLASAKQTFLTAGAAGASGAAAAGAGFGFGLAAACGGLGAAGLGGLGLAGVAGAGAAGWAVADAVRAIAAATTSDMPKIERVT